MSSVADSSPVTRFTPPLNCFDPTWKLSPYGHDTKVESLIIGGGYGAHLSNGQIVEVKPTATFSLAPNAMAKGVTPSCFPSGDKSDGTPSDVGWGCPWGYDTFATITSDSGTTTMCCPTFMGNKEDYQQGKNSMADTNMSSGVYPKDNPTVYEWTACAYWYDGNPAYGIEMPAYGYMGPDTFRVVTFFHSPLQMRWNVKETSPATTFMMATPVTSSPTPTAPAYTTSTATARPEAATPLSKGMPLRAKVGVAVGIAVATTLLSAFMAWFVLQRRRKRKHAMSYELPSDLDRSKGQKVELEGHGSGDSGSIHELDSPEVTRKAELASNWHGTEAPALVEVDLSRPQWEEKAATVDKPGAESSPTENSRS